MYRDTHALISGTFARCNLMRYREANKVLFIMMIMIVMSSNSLYINSTVEHLRNEQINEW